MFRLKTDSGEIGHTEIGDTSDFSIWTKNTTREYTLLCEHFKLAGNKKQEFRRFFFEELKNLVIPFPVDLRKNHHVTHVNIVTPRTNYSSFFSFFRIPSCWMLKHAIMRDGIKMALNRYCACTIDNLYQYSGNCINQHQLQLDLLMQLSDITKKLNYLRIEKPQRGIKESYETLRQERVWLALQIISALQEKVKTIYALENRSEYSDIKENMVKKLAKLVTIYQEQLNYTHQLPSNLLENLKQEKITDVVINYSNSLCL